MQLRLILCFLICFPTALRAQVHELWRAQITGLGRPFEPQTNYVHLTAATVDSSGNTVVGGHATVNIPFIDNYSAAFVAKFDHNGSNVWTRLVKTEVGEGIDGLATDSHGNIYFSIRLIVLSDVRATALVKLAPGGAELWRVGGAHVISPPAYYIRTKVYLDSSDNVFLYSAMLEPVGPGESVSRPIVARFDPDGGMVWSTRLPGGNYGYVLEDVSKPLAFTQDDGLVAVGSHVLPGTEGDLRGIVVKLDAIGDVSWWTDDFKGQESPAFYASVLVSPKGVICASSEAGPLTVFSQNGKSLHTGLFGGQVTGVTEKGRFLLNYSGTLYTIDTTGGHISWMQRLATPGAVSDGADGWFAQGVYPFGVVHLDALGNELWSVELNKPQRGFESFRDTPILRADDGTLRLILSSPSARAVAVIALAVD